MKRSTVWLIQPYREFEVTFKETVCESVDWINLALDKYIDGINPYSANVENMVSS